MNKVPSNKTLMSLGNGFLAHHSSRSNDLNAMLTLLEHIIFYSKRVQGLFKRQKC